MLFTLTAFSYDDMFFSDRIAGRISNPQLEEMLVYENSNGVLFLTNTTGTPSLNVGKELLSDPEDFSGNWTLGGDWDLATLAFEYNDSAHSGALTQDNGDFTETLVASTWYLLRITLTDASTPVAATSIVATLGTSAIAVELGAAGTYYYLIESDAVVTGDDFVIRVTTSTAGDIAGSMVSLRKIDDAYGVFTNLLVTNDAKIENDLIVEGTITIENANPTYQLKDINATVGDVNASIDAQATDVGAGTEDIDVTYAAQVAGTMTDYIVFDADGTLELISTTDIVLDPTGNDVLPGSASGDNLGNAATEWGNIYVGDNRFDIYGNDQDIHVGYDETTNDALETKQLVDAAPLAMIWIADKGDDVGDEAKWNLADGGVLTYGSDISVAGTYVTHLTLTPHATLTTASLAFVGDVDVGDDLFMSNLGVINFNSGDITLTHSADLLDIDGGNTRVDRLEIDSASDYIDVSTDLDIVAAADIVLDPAGIEVHIDGGLSVGDETEVGDNNFKVAGTSLLEGAVTFTTAGVVVSAADGVMTFLGAGDGNDLNLLWDYDNHGTITTVGVSSGAATEIDFGTIALTTTGAITTGDITISDADPVLNYIDTSTDDDDIGGVIQFDATATGTGAEDYTVTMQNQVDGTLRDFLTTVAEGDLTLTSYKGVVIFVAGGADVISNDDFHVGQDDAAENLEIHDAGIQKFTIYLMILLLHYRFQEMGQLFSI